MQSAYCGAKHAVQGFTEAVRCELMHDKSKVKLTMVQLPAMNTPHFEWVKNNLKRKPKPVPPIFQPEVAAKAILWACSHYRREWYVGFPTVLAIVGDKLSSRFADYYLSITGYKSQQYDGKPEDKPNNLYQPASSNHEARGEFTAEASSKCIQFWFSKRRNFLLIFILILFLAWIFYLSFIFITSKMLA